MYSIQSLLLRSPVILSKKIIWICVEYLGKAFQTRRTVWYGSRHWHPCYWSRKLWCRIFSRLVLDGVDTSSLHVQGEGTGLMWTVVSHRQASWVACRWRDSRSRGPCIQKQMEELYIMNATICGGVSMTFYMEMIWITQPPLKNNKVFHFMSI